MPELTSRSASSSADASAASTIRARRPFVVAHDAAVRAEVVGLEREHRRGGALRPVRLDERAHGLGSKARHVAVQHDDVAARRLRARRARSGRRRPCRAPRAAPRPRRRRRSRAVRRRDDDDARDARLARRFDDPVDHPAAEQRVQVLRRRAAHARAEATGHHDCCELVRHVRRGRLGRQDSNLGSRDQNPLPYRLATPQRDDEFYRRSRKR